MVQYIRTEVSVTVKEHQVEIRVLKWNCMVKYISDRSFCNSCGASSRR